MKLTYVAAPFLALALVLSTSASFALDPGQYGPPRDQGYGPSQGGGGGWDQAPPEFREYQQRGFRDGLDGARKDFENHRPPNVNNRDEFRHPGFIPGPFRHDYKDGFRRGYDTAMRHMMGGGPGGPRGPRPGDGYGPR